MNTRAMPVSPLVQIALDWMETDPNEGFRLHQDGAKAIAFGMELLFLSGAPPKPALEGLVALARTLRTEHGANLSSDEILQVILDSEPARALFGLSGRSRPHDLVARLGFDSAHRAPQVGEAAPAGSVPLKDMVARGVLRRR